MDGRRMTQREIHLLVKKRPDLNGAIKSTSFMFFDENGKMLSKGICSGNFVPNLIHPIWTKGS